MTGLSQQVALTAFQGDATWTGYAMISGHWYTGPGQAVVGTGFLNDTGKSVGDTVTLISGGRRVPVKIVGQVFDTDNNGVAMLTDWQTLAAGRARGDAQPVRRRAAPRRLRHVVCAGTATSARRTG